MASLVPTTNPELTPPGVGLFAIKCRDAVIFSPHPRSQRTTRETVEIMRRALAREGAPLDLVQCIERPSIPAAQYLMSQADIVQATGGRDMVKAAYSSGTPAYGVGAGNSTMVIDETADVAEAARNTRISKTSDFGSGCSADGNLIVEDDRSTTSCAPAWRPRGATSSRRSEAEQLGQVLWDDAGRRTPDTIAISAAGAGRQGRIRRWPGACGSSSWSRPRSARSNPFSSEKLSVVLSMFRYAGFDQALEMVEAIYEVGGKGHSCGIYSFDDDHIDRLARLAPVSRIMVRQPQSKANAGSFTNGMPMTSSLGCGTWGGNITSENIHLKHYMNYDLGKPADRRGPAFGRGAVRRVLRDIGRLMSVLAKATEILDLVAESPEDATLTAIAQRLGQPRSSTHRLLSELVELGLLFRVGTANYVPGPRLTRWAEVAGGANDIVRISKPTMIRLRDAEGESVHLYVRQRDRRVCVAAVEGNFELRHFTEVGKPLPLSVGASGKLLLAFADPATQALELRRVARAPVSARAPGIDELTAQLEEIRVTGWSMSFGEREEGLAAAAVPIRNPAGTVQAALAISGPTGRLTAERLVDLRPQLAAAADEIGAAQGWTAPSVSSSRAGRGAAAAESSLSRA